MLSDDIKQCEGLIRREFVEVPEWWVRIKDYLDNAITLCSDRYIESSEEYNKIDYYGAKKAFDKFRATCKSQSDFEYFGQWCERKMGIED